VWCDCGSGRKFCWGLVFWATKMEKRAEGVKRLQKKNKQHGQK